MDQRPRRAFRAVLPSVLCVAAIVAGLLFATGAAVPAVAFAQTGHWVVNATERSVVHVDGGTAQVDARVDLPADAGEPLFALQGDRQGFVVARDRVTVFGRSTLTVDTSIPTGFDEVPVGIETVGGPYLVYRTAGTIVRLGVPPLSLPVGGPVARPVWTDDGTVWLRRTDDGSFCAVRAVATGLDCLAGSAAGEPGGLTVTGALPSFVGTRQDAAQVLDRIPSGPVALGTDLAETGLLADRDTEGRLAVVEPVANRLVLADSGGVPDGRDGSAAIPIDLGPGEFTSPVAANGVIAVVDVAANRLLTFAPTGRRLGTVNLPPGADPTLVRGGDGRIYVDDADGASTHVVGGDGSVISVATGGRLPDTVAVAAPPERRSPVVPPPARTRRPSLGTPGTGGGDPPRPGPFIDPGRNPETGGDPVLPDLVPPVSVTARAAADGAVVVTWPAVAAATAYVVSGSNGSTQRTADATATFDGLPLGRPVTFTVRSASATGESADSPRSNPAAPFGTPGAPGGFGAAVSCADSCEAADLTWQEPDLGGGRLVHYLVTGAQAGRELRSQTVVARSARFVAYDDYDACGTIVFAVQAVTAPAAGDGEELTGPEAVHVFGGEDCVPTPTIYGTTFDGAALFVEVAENKAGRGECTLEIDGITRDTRTCGYDPALAFESTTADFPTYTADIDGLDPSTTYTVTVRGSNGYGTSDGDSVEVTTPP